MLRSEYRSKYVLLKQLCLSIMIVVPWFLLYFDLAIYKNVTTLTANVRH